MVCVRICGLVRHVWGRVSGLGVCVFCWGEVIGIESETQDWTSIAVFCVCGWTCDGCVADFVHHRCCAYGDALCRGDVLIDAQIGLRRYLHVSSSPAVRPCFCPGLFSNACILGGLLFGVSFHVLLRRHCDLPAF
jgi:hypothetical protein